MAGRILPAWLALAALTLTTGATLPSVEVLTPVRAVPAHLAGRFQHLLACAETRDGVFVVLDRRAHTVYAIDPDRTRVRTVIEIGGEAGRVLNPAVLSLAPTDFIAVADAPGGADRVQYFGLDGVFVGGFYLDRQNVTRLRLGSLVLNGVGSMQFTGETFLINRPAYGALFSEFDLRGEVRRHIGVPRATPRDEDAALRQAFNVGLPLVDPTGGYYFVFQTGRPTFRKYAADGTLLFERHIEGVELDATIQALATEWPERRPEDGLEPLVPPVVRAAGVDASGRLWVSLVEPYTYVYDARGDKIRTIRFQAAGALAADSLFFTTRGTVLVAPGCYEFNAD